MQKKCSNCQELKDSSLFGVDKKAKDGKGSYCKECAASKARKWYSENKSRFLQSSKKWRIENKERVAKRKKEYYFENKEHADKKNLEWRHKNKERVYARINKLKRERRKNDNVKANEKNARLKRKYGITLNDYQKMIIAQGNLCAICRENKDKKSLHVDHCHKTGKIRDLLCSRCNTVLGRVDDNIDLVQKMSLYLQRHLTKVAPDLWDSGAV